MDPSRTTQADSLLDELTEHPKLRVVRKSSAVDQYLAEREEKLRAAHAAGNSYTTLARTLRTTFSDLAEKTLVKKIATLIGSPAKRAKGSKKRAISSPAKAPITTPPKAPSPVEPKAKPKAQPKTDDKSAFLRDDKDL